MPKENKCWDCKKKIAKDRIRCDECLERIKNNPPPPDNSPRMKYGGDDF